MCPGRRRRLDCHSSFARVVKVADCTSLENIRNRFSTTFNNVLFYINMIFKIFYNDRKLLAQCTRQYALGKKNHQYCLIYVSYARIQLNILDSSMDEFKTCSMLIKVYMHIASQI